MKTREKLILVAATVLVVSGAGTGVALAMQDEPKKVVVEQSASVTPQNEPVEAVVEQGTSQPSTQDVEQVEEQPAENPFRRGFSEWHVWERRHAVGKTMPDFGEQFILTKAYCSEWQPNGARVLSEPELYAVVCFESNAPGHQNGYMGFIEQVNEDGSFWVSGMNVAGQKSITDTTSAGGFNRVAYNYYPADWQGTILD